MQARHWNHGLIREVVPSTPCHSVVVEHVSRKTGTRAARRAVVARVRPRRTKEGLRRGGPNHPRAKPKEEKAHNLRPTKPPVPADASVQTGLSPVKGFGSLLGGSTLISAFGPRDLLSFFFIGLRGLLYVSCTGHHRLFFSCNTNVLCRLSPPTWKGWARINQRGGSRTDARQTDTFKETEAHAGRLVRGRQLLLRLHNHFATNALHGSVYDMEDLMNCIMVNQNLTTFISNWDTILSGIPSPPDNTLFHRQIN